MIHQHLCNSIRSCLECVLANCHWVEGGDIPLYNCIILQQLTGRPIKVVSPLATERCPIVSTTPSSIDLKIIHGQVTQQQLLTWILVFLVICLSAILVHYLVVGWKWVRNRRNLRNYQCRERSRSPPRTRPVDSSAPRHPSTSQGFRSEPDVAPPDRPRVGTSEESLQADREEARRIGREVRALSLPNWYRGLAGNVVGSSGGGGGGAMELREVDEEALDLGEDEGDEQQPGVVGGNGVVVRLGEFLRSLGNPLKKVTGFGASSQNSRSQVSVEMLGYNPRIAYDPRYPHLPHAPIPNTNLPLSFEELRAREFRIQTQTPSLSLLQRLWKLFSFKNTFRN